LKTVTNSINVSACTFVLVDDERIKNKVAANDDYDEIG
jgi:hypothetical protein